MRFAHALSISLVLIAACKKDEPPRGGDVPPPPPSATVKSGACANPAPVDDPVSAPFLPKTIASYCIDSAPGSTKTYGAQAKLSMDQVCTTAFDGECEVYKRYGLKRVVTTRYIDGGGGAGVVEVTLSQFETEPGAYGMFTKRVVADADPASDQAPKSIGAVGAAALGGGRATAWRSSYVVELVYMNEQETPQKMVKSSEALLPALAKSITDKLPGSPEKPAPVRALPEANLVPLGVQFAPKEALAPFGLKSAAPGATGFYKDGAKRYRVLALGAADEAGAKEAIKGLKGKPGALPVADLGDEATHLVVQTSKEQPKTEWVFARKGVNVLGLGDEELALEASQPLDLQKAVRLTKEEKVAKLKAALK